MELLEILLALAAAFGLLALGWLLFGRLVAPVGLGGPVYAVVRARGDGAGLEQDVNGLLWLASEGMPAARVVIVDAGLTPTGRRRAELLAGQSAVELCRPEELASLLEL